MCYAGAVYAVHSDSSVSRTGFTAMATSDYGKRAGRLSREAENCLGVGGFQLLGLMFFSP